MKLHKHKRTLFKVRDIVSGSINSFPYRLVEKFKKFKICLLCKKNEWTQINLREKKIYFQLYFTKYYTTDNFHFSKIYR